MYEVILKRFDSPDELRTFEKGKFELIKVGGRRSAARPTSQAGNGLCMWARRWALKVAWSSMLGWSYQVVRRRQWTMARSSK